MTSEEGLKMYSTGENDDQFLSKGIYLDTTAFKTAFNGSDTSYIPDPNTGDFKLSVMPFENNGSWVSLPEGFKQWEESFNKVLKYIPLQEGANTHYVTIDTKFFTTDEFLRREGVHMDGNFCVDPYFSSAITEKASWGGASPTRPSWGGARYEEPVVTKSSWGGAGPRPSWGGARYELTELESVSYPKYSLVKKEHNIYSLIRESKFQEYPDNSHVKMDWVLPYDITIPISEYVSSTKGGILTVSTEVGCQAWSGDFHGEVMSEGSFEKMEDQLTDDRKVIFEKNQLYFMSSNTPHETLLISKGKRRTFLRITLNHNYDNSVIS
ncbi:hypothetical protein EBU71_23335 [bacterium]|nr:hypothetical protein [Candidatus Elulimicrobium humile]